MTHDSVVALRKKESFMEDPITDILRNGARQLLAQALEAEIELFIGGSVDFTGPGAALRKPFTVMRFGDRKILLFNHLGDLPCVRVTSAKSL
jgi:hypothetical protein